MPAISTGTVPVH